MAESDLHALLTRLHADLKDAGTVDPASQRLLEQLADDMRPLVTKAPAQTSADEYRVLRDRLTGAAASFEGSHPETHAEHRSSHRHPRATHALEVNSDSGNHMRQDYLLKTEPSEYSFADLQRDKQTLWDGVSNPVALRNLGAMTAGDRLIIYETGNQKSAIGTASVVSVDASDPHTPKVMIKAGAALPSRITLATIKANRLFADSPLVRQGRLSVVPLTATQYDFLNHR